ncbi:MAG: hypothetical protein PF439_00550 [Helicobacteraceae bacterium]|nr:hypothetical protein [Helicobacteraceae bacterium]
MQHAYLTKDDIDRSYRKGAITVREVKELLRDLNRCSKRIVRSERHAKSALQKVAQH